MTKTINALVEALEAENAALRADNASFIVAWKAHLEVAGVSAEIAERMVNETANKLIAARAALAQARAEQAEPFAWLVCSSNKDGSLSLEYAAAWREAAHDHINEAISEHDIEEAATWVVRPAYLAAPVAKLEPLTDDAISGMIANHWCWDKVAPRTALEFARAIEAAHNAKLGGAT